MCTCFARAGAYRQPCSCLWETLVLSVPDATGERAGARARGMRTPAGGPRNSNDHGKREERALKLFGVFLCLVCFDS